MAKTVKRKYKRKRKQTIKRKYKRTRKQMYIGSGPFDAPTPRKHSNTPYDRPNKTPCKYGSECTRKNPAHFKEFSHPSPCKYGIGCNKVNSDEHFTSFTHPPYTRYENEAQIKQFIQECYESYSNNPSNMFAHLERSDISFLKKGLDEPRTIKTTFFFRLLAYIVCHICEIIAMPNGKYFITTMLTRFNEEAIDGNFIISNDEPELQLCIQKLGIPVINCITIISALNDPESDFNKNGCM